MKLRSKVQILYRVILSSPQEMKFGEFCWQKR